MKLGYSVDTDTVSDILVFKAGMGAVLRLEESKVHNLIV